MRALTRSFLFSHPIASATGLLFLAAPLLAQSNCASETLAKHLDAGLTGPRLRTPDGPPIVGRAFSMRVDAGPPAATGALVLGLHEAPLFLAQFGVTLFPAAPFVNRPFALDASGASAVLHAIAVLDPSLCGASAAAQAVVFDASLPGGIGFTNALRLRVGSVRTRALPGLASPYPGLVDSMAAGDMDGDGVLDVVGVDRSLGRLGVGLGRGDGGFDVVRSVTTFTSTVLSALGDVNGDGNLDVVLTNDSFSGSLVVFLGAGNGEVGTPRFFPAGDLPRELVVRDFDGDGKDDVVVANTNSGDLSVYWGWSNGAFQGPTFVPVGIQPLGLGSGDFDGDGAIDLAVVESLGVSILLGAGDATFAPPVRYAVPGLQKELAVGDLNGDGVLDLVLSSVFFPGANTNIETLLGVGDGTFLVGPELVASPQGIGMPLLGDLDQDGILDVGFTESGDRFRIALGNGDGSFAPPFFFRLNAGVRDPHLADFDGDGRIDLVGGHVFSHFAAFYRGLDNATFPSITRIVGQNFPIAIASADFDGDGAPDLAVPNLLATTVDVFLGDGGGRFVQNGSFVAGDSLRAIAAEDLNGDGTADLAIPNGFGVAVLLGEGNGTFGPRTDYHVGGFIDSIDTGDLNGDGIIDLAVTRPANNDVALLFGTGGGAFGAATFLPTGAGPSSVVIRDMDGDGTTDLTLAETGSGNVEVLYGLGSGSFASPTAYPIGGDPSSVDAGDLNSDGILDLAVAVPSLREVHLLIGQGGRQFATAVSHPSGDAPDDLCIKDLDRDGNLDVVVLNRDTLLFASGGTLAVHMGRGDGTFEPVLFTAAQTASGLTGLTLADFDLDGETDAAVVERGGSPGGPPGTTLVLFNLIGE